jgi:TRAP-type C4-dicarboxylate transport system permease small subunit
MGPVRSGWQVWADRIARLSLWIGATATLAMAGLTVADVAGRAFGRPLLLAGELSGYALVALVFGGLAWADVGARHVTITLALDRLAPAWRRRIDRAVLILTAIFVGWLAWFTALPAWQDLALRTRSLAGSGAPMWIPEALIPLGFALLALRLALHAVAGRPDETPRA